jgi:sarcosine oxidase subunit alpha
VKGFRMAAGLDRGQQIEFLCDGQPILAYRGESIAAALLAAGWRTLRTTPQGQPRSLYCGMGVCWECTVSVNGKDGVRACMTPVEASSTVKTGRRES